MNTLAQKLPLIAFTGPAGAGKSHFANYLIYHHRYRRVKFGDPLKYMIRSLLLDAGLSADEVERCIDGDLKEEPIEQLSEVTPRRLMQTLGTEWGRDCIHQDLWINLAETRIRAARTRPWAVVVDDVRFDNEAHLIHNLGGVVISIVPTGTENTAEHVSECGVSATLIDYYIHNADGTQRAFEIQRAADYLLGKYRCDAGLQ